MDRGHVNITYTIMAECSHFHPIRCARTDNDAMGVHGGCGVRWFLSHVLIIETVALS